MIDIPVERVLSGSARTLPPETPVDVAAERLRDPEVSVLVVLEGESVVGVVTESDFVALVAEGRTDLPVERIMSSPVVTIDPSASITLAARRMREAGVRQLPVVEEGTYRGVLTATALSSYLSRNNLEIDWKDEPLRIDHEGAGTAPPGE